VTRSNKLMLGALAALGLVAAYWFLLLAPKRDEAAALATQLSAKQGEVAQAQSTLASYRKAQQNYKATYAEVTQLGKAVPADDDVRSLVVHLDSASELSKVDFRSIELGASTSGASAAAGAPATGPSPPPGAVAVGSAGFSTMPFVFRFKGDYAPLSSLFNRLEQFVTVNNQKIDVTGRLLRLETIELLPDTAGYPKINATVTASSYLVPPTVALTGSASSPTTPTTGGGTSAAITTGASR
jgi:hypothetical protein